MYSPIDIDQASNILSNIVKKTPLEYNTLLSEELNAEIYFKREDLQKVRSYKLRGAYNAIYSLSNTKKEKGVVCASAGNHAQGVAYVCNNLSINGDMFIPRNTPQQKISQVEFHGGNKINITLVGDTFDETREHAMTHAKKEGKTFIESFNDIKVIEGQGTVAKEIYEDLPDADMILVPVGGGGLLAGVIEFYKDKKIEIIPIETEGSPTLYKAIKAGKPVVLNKIDTFADGTSVKKIGDINFDIIYPKTSLPILVPEGKVCSTILELYNKQAIVVEPSGALSVSALSMIKEKIEGKKVVCIISGGNNDINRMNEIIERSLSYEGLKRHFFIDMYQRPGALREFIEKVLGPTDNITRFEYIKKTNKETSIILIGIEQKKKEDYQTLIDNMKKHHIGFKEITKDNFLYSYLI